jgi:hypothetical protein
MAHAGLRREMHHMGKTVLGEQRRHAGRSARSSLTKRNDRTFCELVEARTYLFNFRAEVAFGDIDNQ